MHGTTMKKKLNYWCTSQRYLLKEAYSFVRFVKNWDKISNETAPKLSVWNSDMSQHDLSAITVFPGP